MLFKPHHIEMIKSGTKTETRRNWKRKMAKIGGVYPVQTKLFQPKAECETIKANYVFRQRLGDMSEEEANREGGYTLNEYKAEFTRINGIWDDDLVVYVVGFEHIPTMAAPSDGETLEGQQARSGETGEGRGREDGAGGKVAVGGCATVGALDKAD